MAIQIDIDVTKALNKLYKVEKVSADKAQQSVMNAAFMIEREVKASIQGQRDEPTSVDTGRFFQSVSTANTGFAQAKVFTSVEYAKYLEAGTQRIRARRHFEKTKLRNEKRVKQIIKDSVVDSVRRIN